MLDNFAAEDPAWAAQGFVIAGFAWFHGWNHGLSYTRRARALTEPNYTVWTSTNLIDWAEDNAATQTPGPPNSGAIETVAVTLAASPANGGLFVRVRAAE